MFRKISLIPALGALALAGAAQAQSFTPPSGSTPVPRAEVPVQARMGMHVSALVLEDLRQIVPDQDKLQPLFLRLALLAKQEAIGHSCAAYTLDQRRMVSVMLRTTGTVIGDQEMDKEAAQSTLNRVLRQYNTLLGGELAQFAYEPTGYCNAGKELYESLTSYAEADSPLVLKPTE